MRKIAACILLSFSSVIPLNAQVENLEKYLSGYNADTVYINMFKAIYEKMLERRKYFHDSFTAFKKQGRDPDSFYYDWSEDVNEIKKKLSSEKNPLVRDVLYMSYLDLGYGLYGLKLDSELVNNALNEIRPSSSLWSIEPSLLEAAIHYSNQPDKYDDYVNEVIRANPDSLVRNYAALNLSPDRKIKPGNTVPEFSLSSIDDESEFVTPDKLKGKYYIIDFWAAWCVPCIEEIPRINEIYNKYKSRGFTILSISLDDKEKAEKFRREKFPMPWFNSVADTANSVLKNFEVTGIPCTILVSPAGEIIATGYDLRGRNLDAAMEKYFGK